MARGPVRLLALGAAALSCAAAVGLRAGARPTAEVPRTRLPGGGSLPMSGLGCGRGWPRALEYLRLGGRLLDDSSHRHRHKAIGKAVREAGAEGVGRGDVFVTVKIDPEWFGRENATRWLRRALGDLGLDYVDMVMMHFAGKGGHNPPEAFQGCATWAECRAETWLALSQARASGLVRDLGVSNFGPRQIQGLADLGAAPVAVAQLEYHPWIPEVHRSTVAFCQRRGIAVQAYGSMGSTPKKDEFLTDDRLKGVADGHNKSVGQVLLRWAVQRGVHVIPGSSQPDHMVENMDVFDWRLTEAEMALLSSIPERERRVQYKNKGWHQPDAIL